MLDKILTFIATFLKTKTYTISAGDVGTLNTTDSSCTRMGNIINVSIRVTNLPTDQSGSNKLIASIPAEVAPKHTIYVPYGVYGQSSWQATQYAYLSRAGQLIVPAAQINAAEQIFVNLSYMI